MIKRSRQWIKAYFIFSANERKGIISLLIILCFVILLPSLYAFVFPPQPIQVSITDLSTDTSFAEKSRYENTLTKEPSYITTKSGQQKITAYSYSDTGRRNKQHYPIELNDADSQTIVALYRIGPTLAHRILEYREHLGGFISIDQLKEVWGFDEDILYDLQSKIYVDKSKAKIYSINLVSRDELRTHPYFKYKLSNAIINYRVQHGNYKSLEDLKQIVLVNDSIYQRIILYLKID